jgi:hypothetical protein
LLSIVRTDRLEPLQHCPCLVSIFNSWVGVCIGDARSTNMQRAVLCLSSVRSLAHSRRMLPHTESKRGTAGFTCLCFLRLITTETNGPRPPKIMANSTLIRVSSIHGSCPKAATLKTQPLNCQSDVSQAILSYSCTEPPNRAFRREQAIQTTYPIRLHLEPRPTMADSALVCQLIETQILVLHILRSGCLSTQRS